MHGKSICILGNFGKAVLRNLDKYLIITYTYRGYPKILTLDNLNSCCVTLSNVYLWPFDTKHVSLDISMVFFFFAIDQVSLPKLPFFGHFTGVSL